MPTTSQQKGIQFLDSLNNAKQKKDQRIIPISEFNKQVYKLHSEGFEQATSTGFENLDYFYKIAKGMLTIVTGYASSGKSQFLDQLMINLITQNHNWKVLYASFENRPIELHIAKLLELIKQKPFFKGKNERIHNEELKEQLDFLNQKIAFIDYQKSRHINDLIDVCKDFMDDDRFNYAYVIDPWNEITMPSFQNETHFVSESLTKLKDFIDKTKVHLFLVAHPRKTREQDGTLPIPKLDMISGSMNFWNKADFGITVDLEDKASQQSLVNVYIQKARWRQFGKKGKCKFTYNKITGQYQEYFEEINI